ncbi:54S ribosomal protein L15 [Escovopsis weberi]|uniref:54S ribosomal protein L15 n=1 Tax=Escovopsis weberi TaxID=150374 RepID=A0A0M9VS13_ESCWE|nr:54S ribosomal protein L15 [Escovopsis weberi]
MALQQCRPVVAHCRHASRAFLVPSLRHYTSPTTTSTSSTGARTTAPSTTTTTTKTIETPEFFKIREGESKPRWKETPAQMKAPWQLDFAKNPKNKVWAVNNNPARLDEMYEKLLGPGGSRMLPEELKWLAVTHKSFDYGRRGFNDRLALMGRMTMLMEATKEIVSQGPQEGSMVPDQFDRTPVENQQLLSVDNLNIQGPKDVIAKEKLFSLADKVGLLDVVRWKPRLTRKLESSGVETVLNSAILGIVGALTLQHGSVVASQLVRERILAQLPQDS